MPMYSYKCRNKDCGHKAEKLRKLEDRGKPIECSKCGDTAVNIPSAPSRARVIGGTPIHYTS